MSLTLMLLEPKVISLCHQYRARLDCTVAWPTLSCPLDIPKNDMMESFKMEGGLFRLRNAAGYGLISVSELSLLLVF